ncbi:hypothetical protein LRB11_13285 [Ectothiorhodospira haloalkaliphila]|uniref:hypothetical protein n=1 Tax=Ectothiorhodospira haloalkaliphila TaxID=421628 RepID=UPI001EE97E5A|nr:hypothetical protein [Ectothiorhodospira haloalkaliphila]MCG5525894.1 hypothetical protein [Ectothiorhodospira haloalkaliphila]
MRPFTGRPTSSTGNQHGGVILILLFIITVGSAVLAAAVLQISVQQHDGQARTYLAEQARYAALGRLAEAQEFILDPDNEGCP